MFKLVVLLITVTIANMVASLPQYYGSYPYNYNTGYTGGSYSGYPYNYNNAYGGYSGYSGYPYSNQNAYGYNYNSYPYNTYSGYNYQRY